MKTIGYIRVSTDEQTDSGLGLEAQRRNITDYCALYGLELAEIISDEGISAKDMKHRPGFQRILEMARRREIDAVVVYKLDRAFRNTIDALSTARELEGLGVAFHSVHEKIDTKSAMGVFFFTLLAALAEMERVLIGERTRDALKAKKARAGGKQISGAAGYGWTWQGADGNKRLVEVEEEQAIIRQILELANHIPALSPVEIAERFDLPRRTVRRIIGQHQKGVSTAQT